MALSPLQRPQDRVIQTNPTSRPTKTYKLNFDTGRMYGTVDGKDALKQFIYKTIITTRFRFPIYNDQYGCELEDLIGEDIPFELLKSDVSRVIKDALIYDDRINEINDFTVIKENDKLFISFTVDSIYGEINEEVIA